MIDIASIYLHVPFCRHLCNYCDFFKYKEGSDKAPSWEEFELKLDQSFDEISNLEKFQCQFQFTSLKTFYLGGGTPSLWGEQGQRYLKNFIEKHNIELQDEYQWTLEVDPGTCSRSQLQGWRDLGVNRFSLGLQTLDESYLEIADREHTQEDAIEMLEMLSSEKVSFSADFLLGLPRVNGSIRDIEKELNKILSYEPDHLSLYILTVPKSYEYYDQLPEDEEIEKEYLFVSEYLKKHGFTHYEVSNFSKTGRESKHNFIYWNGESYLGLGPSATGQFRQSRNEMTRFKWNSKYELILEKLGLDELELEELYMCLRTNKGFKPERFESGLISNWLERGLVEKLGNQYIVTSKGFLIADSMIEQVFSL